MFAFASTTCALFWTLFCLKCVLDRTLTALVLTYILTLFRCPIFLRMVNIQFKSFFRTLKIAEAGALPGELAAPPPTLFLRCPNVPCN